MEARRQREGKLYSMGCARRKPNICIRRMIKRKIRRDTIEDRKCTGDKTRLSPSLVHNEKSLVDSDALPKTSVLGVVGVVVVL